VITPEQFARALVERLAPILPPGFTARAQGDFVAIDPPDGPGGGTTLAGLLDRDDLEPQDYADAAWNVLSLAQDVVSETMADPWPAAMGPGRDLAEPGAQIEGDTIRLFFGAEDQPVLILPPIDLKGSPFRP
jgi:hypothetical protein